MTIILKKSYFLFVISLKITLKPNLMSLTLGEQLHVHTSMKEDLMMKL